MSDAVIHRVSVYRVGLPTDNTAPDEFSRTTWHESIVVQAETARGMSGWGEAQVRPGLMGESVASVLRAMEQVYLPRIAGFHPASFPEALEAIEALPWDDAEDRPCPTARAAIELALVDGALRVFDRDVDALVRWMGLPGFGSPGSLERIRSIGVLSEGEPDLAMKRLRWMYWGGVRDFKVRVGFDGDIELVRRVADYLAKPIRAKRASLRVDAQGAWDKDLAIEWLSDALSLPLAAVEQPMSRGSEVDLPILSDLFEVPLVHDESLVTMADAHRLKGLGVADGFNLSVDKCGGLLATLRLAAYARREGVRLTCGASDSAAGIVSAARMRFLQVCPGVEWAEDEVSTDFGLWGVLRNKLRFGHAGRRRVHQGVGLGGDVDAHHIHRLSIQKPTICQL